MVPKLLLQVSAWELHNRRVSDTEYGWLKEARDAENNIITVVSTLHSLFPPQFQKTLSRYKFMGGCECCISAKSIHLSLLSWCGRYFKNSRVKVKILKTEGLGKNKITYMKHTKYSHATWAWYLRQSIWYGKVKNVCVSTVRSCVTTLEMCIAVLFQMS